MGDREGKKPLQEAYAELRCSRWLLLAILVGRLVRGEFVDVGVVDC